MGDNGMNARIRSVLSRINFAVGRNPRVKKCWDRSHYIPEPFQAVVLIQADFEMAWAWRYSKSFFDPLSAAMEKARQERSNIPKILELCDRYQIPITWATVGHLFLSDCQRVNGIPHPEIGRLGPFENEYWRFSGGDWFEYDPCSTAFEAPEWYAPDLIKEIIDGQVKHEIACHTFSHVDCRDRICPPKVMRSEIEACKKVAAPYGLELKSFVHPGHTIGNLEILREFGFLSFRTDYTNILGYPIFRGDGLWELKSTMEFVFRKEWSAEYHIYRYKRIVDRAIRNHSVCIFWFHPSLPSLFVEKVMPEIFSYLDEKREEVYLATSAEYAVWLNGRSYENQ